MEKSIHIADIGLILKYVKGLPNNENHIVMENREENINTIYTVSCYIYSFNTVLNKNKE